jgi:hypothetical protein
MYTKLLREFGFLKEEHVALVAREKFGGLMGLIRKGFE